MTQQPQKIEISHKTVVFIAVFLMMLWFLYIIRDILFQIFVSLLIMTILNPTVTKLHRKLKVPRALSVIIVYIIVLAIIAATIALVIPPLVEQTGSFANSLPQFLTDLRIPSFVADQFLLELTSQLGRLPTQLIRMSLAVFSNILSVFAVFIFALYLLLARNKLDEQLGVMFKDDQSERIERIFVKLEQRLGGWARGQLILMALVGVMTYIGLILIGIPYALPLALLAGLFEIIPNIGPVVAAVPMILVGFSVSPLTGFAAAALGILVQQMENYIFVPKVMEKSAGVSPIITLLALVVGFKLAGVVGAMLSVPVVITIKVMLDEFLSRKLGGE